MTPGDLLSELLDRGIQIWRAGLELRVRAPRNALTPALTAELRRRKQELLAALEPGRKLAPLSFAQERLWFLHRLEPGDASYNVLEAWWIRGRLDPAALARSLGGIVARHETLRTRFTAVEGRGVQSVELDPPAFEPARVDLSRVPAGVRRSEASSRAAELAGRPPELAAAAPFTAALFHLGRAEHLLLVKIHHLLADGWSLGLLRRELASLYAADLEGRPAALARLPLQYADFAVRQRQELAGETLEAHLDYWRRQLAGLADLRLPTDRPRGAAAAGRGALVALRIPEMWTELARRRAVEAGASLYMVTLAAFTALLGRYSHQADVVVGTPIANRTREEIEGLIGFFVNTLVMRADLGGDPPGRELVRRVRETALGAYAHQDLPFEVLVDDLAPPRDLGRNPLFQVSFALQNAPEPAPDPPGLAFASHDLDARQAHFDLELHLHESRSGLEGLLVFRRDLFDETTVRRLAGHFERLLVALASRPERRLPELELQAAHERHQLILEWNDAPAADGEDVPWHRLFERQARRTPDAVAAVAGDAAATYGELAARAGGRARELRTLGVGPERRVAVRAERSIDFLAEVLAVLAAGGAYVPVEGGGERSSWVLRDSGAVEVAGRGAPPHPGPLLQGGEGVFPLPDPANAAYVIYTSGSGGRPKGVVVEHRQLVAYVRAISPVLRRPASAAPFTGFATDLAHTMVFPVLASGGRVHLPSPETTTSGADAARFFARRPVDVAKSVPSQMAALLEAPGARELVPRRRTVLGGEALPWDLVRRLRALAPRAAVVNHYGPTETTVGVATFEAGALRDAVPPSASMPSASMPSASMPSASMPSASVPIGRPLAGSSLVLADRRLRPVPAGVHGEIAVGGPQVARGYLGRPGLTAARFVPDPFVAGRGARLYLTGDRARRLADGAVEFLGRFDRQVKVRGFRVEPGEIEAVMRELGSVREAAVAFQAERRRLVAFYAGEASPAEVAGFLAARLPAYMVPAAVERLGALPRSGGGKLDRGALERRAGRAAEPSGGALAAPGTPTEEALAEIWSELLGVRRVDVHASFFELGGHSLLGIRLISRVERIFRVELPLKSLFEGPTVARLARGIDRALETGAGLSLPPIAPAARDAPLPLSFAQQRLYTLDRLAPGSPAYNMPAVFRLRGLLDAGALKLALSEVVRRHETLRTTFAEIGGRPRQVISEEVRLPWVLVDLRGLAGPARLAECARLEAEDARLAFDLGRGPLVRVRLLALEGGEHRLVLGLHHIVSDGWSHGVLHRELGALYRACRSAVKVRLASEDGAQLNPKGARSVSEHRPQDARRTFTADGHAGRRSSPLAELPVQYADYAVWQRRWLESGAFAAELTAAAGRLAEVPPAELTPDRPRPRTPTHRGAAAGVEIPGATSARLAGLAAGEKVTLYMALLAGFMALLHRATGQRRMLVGSPIAQRNRREIEDLIGFFVNMTVMRGELSAGRRFTDLLADVRESALEAYARQSLPFEKLVEELAPERDLARHPVFQIAFALQNAPRAELELPGLAVERLDPPALAARFDLELFMWQEEGGELAGTFVYATDLFDRTTIQRLAGHLARVLEKVAETPRARLGELAPWSAAEAHQVLREWNDVEVRHERELFVHEVFAETARAFPEAAVVFEGRRLGYRELDRRAGRLAAELAGLGVGPESRVGLVAERSFEMVVALLGVLEAGGAFVPLDPELPRERLEYLERDSGVELVLTCRPSALEISRGPGADGRSRRAGSVPGRAACRSSAEAGSACLSSGAVSDRAVVRRSLTYEDAAYVVYTSGTTGRPKGVVVTHRGIASHMAWMRRAHPLGRRDKLVQKTPLSFDVAVWEIFWALTSGADLVLARGGHPDPEYLVRLAASEAVTVLHFVPSMLPLFLDQPGTRGLGSLERVVCGGEELTPEVERRFHELLPGVRLDNFYGPSEVTVGTTGWRCDPRRPAPRVPIGRGVDNVRTRVLGPELAPVAAGQAGELAAGGAQLARGYLGRPRPTAAAFVPDPFADEPGERLYRTGDLARQRPDGVLEYLGRRDHQVQVHGVRVEPGEIEAVLAEHEAVREAVAVIGRGSRLVACATVSAELREAWSQRQVAHWRRVYDALHGSEEPPDPGGDDPFFDVAGWNDSFTGAPIPVAEMREWLDGTAARILELAPRRLLEIGCGNGLVLGRIAPAAAEYTGTDFSRAALDVLRRRLERAGRGLPPVHLLERTADDFSGLGEDAFDTVVLSSVVQYFPSADYLVRVLEGAVRAARAGGAVFVGDVRSLPLLDALSASVELFRAPPSLPAAELRGRIRRRRLHEEELLVDPAFFDALAARVPRISGVRVLPKPGPAANELTRFRYDVVLHVAGGAPAAPPPVVTRLDWRRDGLDAAGLRRRLAAGELDVLVVTGVPNPRLARENRLLELLDEGPGPATAAELVTELGRTPAEGPDPDELAALVRGLPYAAEASWAAGRKDGGYDAVFRRSDLPGPVPVPARPARRDDRSRRVNDPLLGKIARELEPRLREHLSRRLPAAMVPSAVLVLDSLPHLASGKVDRAALRGLDAELSRDRGRPRLKETFAAPRTPSEKALARVWCELLDLDRAGARDNFFQLGGDSILGIRIVSRARELGLEIRLADLFRHQTIAGLARLADSRTGRAAEPAPASGPAPLTPIQHWFFEQEMAEPWHYNQSVLLAGRHLSPPAVEEALRHLIRHHDMLRARFSRRGDAWRQSVTASTDAVPFSRVDLTRLGADRRRAEIRSVTSRLHSSLDLTGGPLLRAALLDPDRLFLAVHHLVVDRVSWPILLEDLERACRRLGAGRPVELPAKTTSYREWAGLLVGHAASRELLAELPRWRDALPAADPGLPVDGAGPNLRASVETCSSVLGVEETRGLLHGLPSVLGTRVTEPLLVALVRAFAAWTGRGSLLVDVEGHGREELFAGVDLSRTVGWFTSSFPVFLDLGASRGDEEALAAVRDRLASLPHHGLGYGILRYLAGVPELRRLPRPQVRFNYMGRIEPASRELFDFADEPEGAHTSPRQDRGYLFELNGYVVGGELRFDWHYSRDLHRRTTVEELARAFAAELRRIVRNYGIGGRREGIYGSHL